MGFALKPGKNFLKYLLGRLGEGLLTIWIILSVTFLLLRLLPGGPFDEEKPLPELTKKIIEKKYGLDESLGTQYLKYIGSTLKGDFGYSYKLDGRPVSEIFFITYPNTFILGFFSILISILGGIFFGLFTAVSTNKYLKNILNFLTIAGITLPNFLVAPLLIYFFSFGYPWGQWFPELLNIFKQNNWLLPSAMAEDYRHFILPIITLSIHPTAAIARLTKASANELMASDFMRTARSKGLSESVVVAKHLLTNTLIPVLGYLGPMVANILMGSFVVEIIFSINGVAKYFVDSVFYRDYPVILALTWVFSVLLVVCNIGVDGICKWLDPRWENQ